MVAFDVAPSLVKIFYHSPRGSHVMTRPTRQWVGTAWEGEGEFPRWSDDVGVAAGTMVTALVDLMLPLYTEDVIFDSYIIYNVETVAPDETVNVPVWAAAFTGKAGAITDDVQYLAWQKTYSFLSTDSHNAKLVLLDVPTGGAINKSGSVTGNELALCNAFIAATYAWSARDDNRPVVFRSVNNSVNKALERKYGF